LTTTRSILRYVIILTGLCLSALGTNFALLAGLGTDPWTVFHAGLANYLPLTIGQISQLVGIVIILFSYPLGIRAQIGTFLNMYFFGFFYDMWNRLGLFPAPTSLFIQCLYLVVGVIVLGAGLGLYISAGLGAGPRDGLTLGLHRRLGLSIRFVRSAMELAVLLVGYLIGGPVGIGTLFYALTIGPAMQCSLQLCNHYISPFLAAETEKLAPSSDRV